MTALRALTAMLVALFMGGAGVQDTLLLCRSMKTVHHTCCCPHTLELPALGDELSRPPCCDAASLKAAAIPPSAGAASNFLVAIPVLIELGPITQRLVMLPQRSSPFLRAVDQLATGPPLHIRHHALLI